MSTTNDSNVDGTESSSQNNSQEGKTYTQEEFDSLMAKARNSFEAKWTKKFEGVDVEEYRALKDAADKAQLKKQIDKGEFQKTLQELADKKDAEITKRDNIIKEYKVNTPIINAAAKYKAVNPEQVQQLIQSRVRLNADGDVEVVDDKGAAKYTDSGTAYQVDDLVRDFLDSNPHFVQPNPSTTNSQSNHTGSANDVDISKLDLTKQADREVYKKLKAAGKVS